MASCFMPLQQGICGADTSMVTATTVTLHENQPDLNLFFKSYIVEGLSHVHLVCLNGIDSFKTCLKLSLVTKRIIMTLKFFKLAVLLMVLSRSHLKLAYFF